MIEAVLRRNASSLGLVLAPMGESIEALRTGTEFYQTQLAANEQVGTSMSFEKSLCVQSIPFDGDLLNFVRMVNQRRLMSDAINSGR